MPYKVVSPQPELTQSSYSSEGLGNMSLQAVRRKVQRRQRTQVAQKMRNLSGKLVLSHAQLSQQA